MTNVVLAGRTLPVSKEELEKVQAVVAEGMAREGLQDVILPPEEVAAKRLADISSDAAVDRMIADAQEAGIPLLDGPDGLISQLTAKVIERALGAEMDDHLGYVKGDPAGNGSGNSRNGCYGKTVTTTSGPVRNFGAAGPEFRFPAGHCGEGAAAQCHVVRRDRAFAVLTALADAGGRVAGRE